MAHAVALFDTISACDKLINTETDRHAMAANTALTKLPQKIDR